MCCGLIPGYWLCLSPHCSFASGISRGEIAIERRLQEVFAAAENKDFDRLDSYHFYGPKFTKFSVPHLTGWTLPPGERASTTDWGPARA